VRTSKRRVLRLMRDHVLLAPSRVGAPRGPRNHDGTIIPEAVNTMWGTDLTTIWTGEGQVAVFAAVDHCSAECVGLMRRDAPRASRRWNRSARTCGSASPALRRRLLLV
jgi:transposase InsO family protein